MSSNDKTTPKYRTFPTVPQGHYRLFDKLLILLFVHEWRCFFIIYYIIIFSGSDWVDPKFPYSPNPNEIEKKRKRKQKQRIYLSNSNIADITLIFHLFFFHSHTLLFSLQIKNRFLCSLKMVLIWFSCFQKRYSSVLIESKGLYIFRFTDAG